MLIPLDDFNLHYINLGYFKRYTITQSPNLISCYHLLFEKFHLKFDKVKLSFSQLQPSNHSLALVLFHFLDSIQDFADQFALHGSIY